MEHNMISLEAADILFTRENTLASWLIRVVQGDCDWSHVCLSDGEGRIHTTGGKHFAWYGVVDAQTYLKNKSFAVGRFMGLTPEQKQAIMQKSNTLCGNFYPFWKVLHLAWVRLRGKQIKQIGNTIDKQPKNTFCSESVAYCYEAAGIVLSPRENKREPQAYTPESIYNDPRINIIYFLDAS
jgi:hypothetical protein